MAHAIKQEQKPISILLVDDNATFLDILSRFLQKQDGLNVVGTAYWSEEALVRAPELEPNIILIDLAMPDSSGLEAIPRIKARLPNTGVIMLTVMNNEHYRQAALAAGADAFIPKTNLYTDLLPIIRQVAEIYPGNS